MFIFFFLGFVLVCDWLVELGGVYLGVGFFCFDFLFFFLFGIFFSIGKGVWFKKCVFFLIVLLIFGL